MLPLLKNPSKKILYVSCLSTVISILIVTYVMQIKGINALLIMYAGPFPVWLAFFVLGLYLANSDRMYKLHFIVLFVLIGAVLSYFEYQFLFSFHGQGAGIKLSAYIYSFALLLFLFSKRIETCINPKFIINRMLVYLGEIAFGIYLTHMFFVTIINHFHINVHLNWPVYFFLILIISTGFVTAIKKLLSENALKYIGF